MEDNVNKHLRILRRFGQNFLTFRANFCSHFPSSALVVVLVSLLGYVLRLIAPTSGHRREVMAAARFLIIRPPVLGLRVADLVPETHAGIREPWCVQLSLGVNPAKYTLGGLIGQLALGERCRETADFPEIGRAHV